MRPPVGRPTRGKGVISMVAQIFDGRMRKYIYDRIARLLFFAGGCCYPAGSSREMFMVSDPSVCVLGGVTDLDYDVLIKLDLNYII